MDEALTYLTDQCGPLGALSIILIGAIATLYMQGLKRQARETESRDVQISRYEGLLKEVLVQQGALDKTLDALTDGLSAQALITRLIERGNK